MGQAWRPWEHSFARDMSRALWHRLWSPKTMGGRGPVWGTTSHGFNEVAATTLSESALHVGNPSTLGRMAEPTRPRVQPVFSRQRLINAHGVRAPLSPAPTDLSVPVPSCVLVSWHLPSMGMGRRGTKHRTPASRGRGPHKGHEQPVTHPAHCCPAGIGPSGDSWAEPALH